MCPYAYWDHVNRELDDGEGGQQLPSQDGEEVSSPKFRRWAHKSLKVNS